MKYVAAIVIGLIMIILLYAFLNPKINQAQGITGVNDGKTGIPNPACYTNCAMEVSKNGGSYKSCVAKDCDSW